MDKILLDRIKERIEYAEKKLKELEEDIDKGVKAGIDMSDLIKRKESLKRQIAQLKAVYSE